MIKITSKRTAKGRPYVSTLLAIAILFSLLTAIPITANAEDMATLANMINNFDPGNGGPAIGQLSAAVSGNTVTITGTVTGATTTLGLSLDSGVTVRWEASYSGEISALTDELIILSGLGTFEVPEGGSIIAGSMTAIRVAKATTVNVSGGIVSSEQSIAIHAYDNITVNVGGGIVSSEQSIAIYSKNAVTVNVSGGAVTSKDSDTINLGHGSFVNVKGGIISSEHSFAIYSQYAITVNVSGGAVSAEGFADAISLGLSSVVNVSGGTVSVSGEGRYAIYMYDAYPDSTVIVSGGTVISNNRYASIHSVSGSVEVTGGVVCAISEYAIYAHKVLVTGGIVFGIGRSVTGDDGTEAAIRYDSGGSAIIGVTGIVCAWGKPETPATYTEGLSTDLIVTPVDARAVWGKIGSQSGINYKNGSNSGFLPIDGVTVNAAASTIYIVTFNSNGGSTVQIQTVQSENTATKPTPDPIREAYTFGEWYADEALTTLYDFNTPVTADITLYAKWNAEAGIPLTIIGPTAMTLTEGYAAISTGVYTITGTPMPTVTKESGDLRIEWNNATKKLDIAVGLNAGIYLVVLAASNTIGNATYTFTLTVEEAATTTSSSTSMTNFTMIRTYTPGMFTDVVESMWYGYNNERAVANAYEYGLMSGYPDSTLRLAGNMTLAEAITIAARVHNIYNGGDGRFTQGSIWYQVYVDYAISEDIIGAVDFTDYNIAATRAQMAYIFSRSIPVMEFTAQNTVNSLPDTNNGTPHYDAILMMYKAGVVGGDEGTRAFRPGDNVSRAEAAAIITRVILPASRLNGRIYG